MKPYSFTATLAATVLAVAQLLTPATAHATLVSIGTKIVSYPDTPLRVSLDDPRWTYELGKSAEFLIKFDLQPYPTGGVPITYRLGPDMLEGPVRTAVVPPEGLRLPVASPAQPGFVRCLVTAVVQDKQLEARATAAFSPQQIRPVQVEPADFDQFWQAQRTALDQVAPQYQLTRSPALSTAQVEVSYLSFQNVGQQPGSRPTRIYGVLSVPRGAGPYPAVLHVPGAGVRGYKGTPDLAAKGFITLQIGIHGIPVNLPDELYEQLNAGALESYNRYNLDNRDAYYYRRVYLGALRALDYLALQPKWNGKHMVVQGGSQGGQLAIVASALDPRVTGTVASYPAFSDVTGYLHGRAGGWPGLFRLDAGGRVQDQPIEAKVVTSAYYDTVNFARRLRAPGLYYTGFNDMVTPPTSTMAVFNSIRTSYKLMLDPPQVHLTSPEHQAAINRWLLDHVAARP
jgi:cephalosporin-C deacetylase-like acetyl esterase